MKSNQTKVNRKSTKGETSRLLVLIIACLLSIVYFNFQFRLEVETNDTSDPNISVRKSISPATSLPPVHINSSWIGDQWIPPPGYRTYSTRELQTFFANHSILFVGDSTARRSYATLYSILNKTNDPDNVSVFSIHDEKIIDVNKGHKTEFCDKEGYFYCRKTSQNNVYDLINKSCLGDAISTSMLREWVNQYTLVIYALGPWEIMDKAECGAGMFGRKNQTDDIFQILFEGANDSKHTRFIWRTWGSPGTKKSNPKYDKTLWNKARAHNDYVKMLIDKNDMSRKNEGKELGAVSYIDWGKAMLPRLYPAEQRISGDIDAHYGWPARVTFIQMLMNHLVEMDRQKQLKISPWFSKDQADNHTYDDPEQFMTTYNGGTDEVKMIKLSFCNDCLWAKGISCGMRMANTVHKGASELKALVYVMETPSCNNSAIENTTFDERGV